MPILRALSGRSSPVTAAQLSRLAEAGTEAGVLRALERLAAHGVCLSDDVGGGSSTRLTTSICCTPRWRSCWMPIANCPDV